MTVFDPNTDYTNSNDPASLYNTVMEVQKVLQEITNLLQAQDTQPQIKSTQRVIQPEANVLDSDTEDTPEEQSTIYDNLF